MATDLYPSSPVRPSVRRCLFGPPGTDSDIDEFMESRKRMDLDAARRFKRRWNIDVLRDELVDGGGGGGGYQWITKSSSDSDIPEFYSKGYSHRCKRRAVTPCVGKSLSLMDSDEKRGGSVSPSSSPVQYFSSSTVDVLIGVKLSSADGQTEAVTPLRSNHQTIADSASANHSAESSGASSSDSEPYQTRLTGKCNLGK